jgi:endogenous inhibitor of DNA gyrase (YacG/DUF329 family)
MTTGTHRPPCPKCRKPVGYEEANGDFCPHCEAPIVWGVTIGSSSGRGFKGDEGHWSIRTDHCNYCVGWNGTEHPYGSVPLRKGLDVDGNEMTNKVCDKHLPLFEKEQERNARIRQRRGL